MKEPGTYAAFDVAKEAFLSLLADWREANVKPIIDDTLQGNFMRCTSAGDDAAVTAWRASATSAKLLSLCSHGGPRSIEGCASKVYVKGAIDTGGEVNGAVIHLLACETMPDLGEALVSAGAEAVIGYDAPFSFFTDADEVPATLPAATVSAVNCDAQVLFALAQGKTVQEAVDAAKAWASEEAARLIALARIVGAGPRAHRNAAWRLAVLTTNAEHLTHQGIPTATVTGGN